MTAVLSATDPLRRDRVLPHHDDSHYQSSSDWKQKYLEVADMLSETRAELEDFQQSSKELEEELEKELERTEKAQQDLKVKAAKAEAERDEWKSKFMSLQTTHNTTTTSLQRELDQLRQEQQKVKAQLRELEMGNDNLERNERAISSSLTDIESKYNRALEEKILLEHELLDKANIEEEHQRLKDQLRDANEEVIILKEQLSNRNSRSSMTSTEESSKPVSTPSTSTHSSTENLLLTEPPPDLKLTDLSLDLPSDSQLKCPSRPTSLDSPIHASLQRALQPPRSHFSNSPSSLQYNLARSTTLPNLSPSPTKIRVPKTPVRPIANRNVSTSTTIATSNDILATASRSKGVQMVSEMRARVKNLEQRIHTRVPKLRMGSVTKSENHASYSASTPSSSTSTASTTDDLGRTIRSKKRPEAVTELKRPSADTSGWVLIMEDSPSPVKDREREMRNVSSPSAPSAFRLPPPHYASPSSSPLANIRSSSAMSKSVMNTGIRRPQSRLSDGKPSASTMISTTSSIPTSIARPSTPTFIPVPSASLYNSTAGGKLPIGLQGKRSSLGSGSPPSAMPQPNHPYVTMRSKLPGPNATGQSRIGKPSGRRSAGPESLDAETLNNSFSQCDLKRSRSGSAAAF